MTKLIHSVKIKYISLRYCAVCDDITYMDRVSWKKFAYLHFGSWPLNGLLNFKTYMDILNGFMMKFE